MKRALTLLIAVLFLAQPGCIWKLWSRSDPEAAQEEAREKVYDVYGTVESISSDSLVVQTKKGQERFIMDAASIKGGDFGPGAYVHIYYKQRESGLVVTMVVEKID